MKRRGLLWSMVEKELTNAYAKHGSDQWGRHEFYAILLEEVDELWNTIKGDESDECLVAELAQVIAMCFRFIETGDRYGVGFDAVLSQEVNLKDEQQLRNRTSSLD